MSILSNQSFYWGTNNGEIIYVPARYTVDSEGNAICTHTFSLEHAFDECTKVNDYGLYYAFHWCTGITGSVSFPKLTSIGRNGLYSAFDRCTGITSVSFPELTSIDDYGLYYAFSYCTGITGSVSFPKLTSLDDYGLYYAFQGCTGITGIHFRADAKSTIELRRDFDLGVNGAIIHFDL